MSRCKACDTIMNEWELKRIDMMTGLHLDLCNVCKSHSNDAITENGEEMEGLYSGLTLKQLDYTYRVLI